LKYSDLLNTHTKEKWKRIGTHRRSGVAVPLFSVYSTKSIGIGEIPDIKFLIKWCEKTSMSILQLLPMNDLGNDFAPYNAVSSFALEPMYLSINKLKDVNLAPFKREIREIKKLFMCGNARINYGIKKAKLDLLWKIYIRTYTNHINKFEEFNTDNSYWLWDYALYKIVKEKCGNKNWEKWETVFKNKDEGFLKDLEKEYSERITFYYWIQWQLYEQLKLVKKYAQEKEVLLMGDLPFLVARDSSDVWVNKNYFKLHLSSGAPPDMYFAMGQKWGMPPYNWGEIEKDKYIYIKERLKFAENFYDMFRIDHFVGLFRVWTTEINTPEEQAGLIGNFDPQDEQTWEENGKKIIDLMIQNSEMLPCAEDLGTVPDCSNKILEEYGIPGMNVQRWVKEKYNYYKFINPENYRINSMSTVSTHDSSTLIDWWYNEAGTIDEKLFKRLCFEKGIDETKYLQIENALFDTMNSNSGRLFWKKEIENLYMLLDVLGLNIEEAYKIIELYLDSYNEKKIFWKYIGMDNNFKNKISTEFIKEALIKINQTSCIFCIQLLQEWLTLEDSFLRKNEESCYRINFPGIIDDKNWTTVLPFSLEELLELNINKVIQSINQSCDRK